MKKTIMTVQELIDSLQNCTKDSRVFLAILPLNEAAGIVGVQNCEVLDFESRQMAPVVFLGIKNFSALAHAKFDVKTFNVRMILKVLNNWDSFSVEKSGISETRIQIYKEIIMKYSLDRSMNVERELASWLANFDDQNLVRCIEFIAQKG